MRRAVSKGKGFLHANFNAFVSARRIFVHVFIGINLHVGSGQQFLFSQCLLYSKYHNNSIVVLYLRSIHPDYMFYVTYDLMPVYRTYYYTIHIECHMQCRVDSIWCLFCIDTFTIHYCMLCIKLYNGFHMLT